MLPEIWVASEKRPRYTKQKRKATRVAELQRGTFGACVDRFAPYLADGRRFVGGFADLRHAAIVLAPEPRSGATIAT